MLLQGKPTKKLPYIYSSSYHQLAASLRPKSTRTITQKLFNFFTASLYDNICSTVCMLFGHTALVTRMNRDLRPFCLRSLAHLPPCFLDPDHRHSDPRSANQLTYEVWGFGGWSELNADLAVPSWMFFGPVLSVGLSPPGSIYPSLPTVRIWALAKLNGPFHCPSHVDYASWWVVNWVGDPRRGFRLERYGQPQIRPTLLESFLLELKGTSRLCKIPSCAGMVETGVEGCRMTRCAWQEMTLPLVRQRVQVPIEKDQCSAA